MEFLALQLHNCSLCLHSHMAFSLCVSLHGHLFSVFLAFLIRTLVILDLGPTLFEYEPNLIKSTTALFPNKVTFLTAGGQDFHIQTITVIMQWVFFCEFFLLSIKFEIDPYVVGITSLFLFVFKYLSTGWLYYTLLAVLFDGTSAVSIFWLLWIKLL